MPEKPHRDSKLKAGRADAPLRMAAANSLLNGTPYKPRIYEAQGKLRIFVERMGTGFANIDIPAIVNYGNGYLMKNARGPARANVPWGGTQDRMIACLVTWVLEGGEWRDGYWSDMVKEHGHWLDAEAVATFVSRLWTAPGASATPDPGGTPGTASKEKG